VNTLIHGFLYFPKGLIWFKMIKTMQKKLKGQCGISLMGSHQAKC